MRSWDGFEVRNPVYLPGFRPHGIKYDVVKWENHEPRIVSGIDGQLRIVTESCYSVAFLIWNSNEEEFKLESVGMRLLESHPSVEAMNMICEFARKKREELVNANG